MSPLKVWSRNGVMWRVKHTVSVSSAHTVTEHFYFVRTSEPWDELLGVCSPETLLLSPWVGRATVLHQADVTPLRPHFPLKAAAPLRRGGCAQTLQSCFFFYRCSTVKRSAAAHSSRRSGFFSPASDINAAVQEEARLHMDLCFVVNDWVSIAATGGDSSTRTSDWCWTMGCSGSRLCLSAPCAAERVTASVFCKLITLLLSCSIVPFCVC